jgi:hypothetical protein
MKEIKFLMQYVFFSLHSMCVSIFFIYTGWFTYFYSFFISLQDFRSFWFLYG